MSFTENFKNKLFKKRNNYTKFYSFYSRTTNQTFEELTKRKKNKTVSFSGVEIINVESYKEFNKLDGIQIETIEFHITKDCKECDCIII